MPRVLLVRPNDFILDSMVALMVRLGFEPLRVASPKELEVISLGGVVGAVISTAVTSTMAMSFVEAVQLLRRRAPALPLIATTMVREVAKASSVVEGELAELQPRMRALAISPATLTNAALGTSQVVLVLRKDDAEAGTPLVDNALVQHLRGHE